MPNFDYNIIRTSYVSTLNDSIKYIIIIISVRSNTPRATEVHPRGRVLRITHYYGSTVYWVRVHYSRAITLPSGLTHYRKRKTLARSDLVGTLYMYMGAGKYGRSVQ